MNEIGIDLSGQSSKPLKTYLGRISAHYVVFVCDRAEAACPTLWPWALKGLSWPFEDPAACRGTEEERVAKFREVRDLIQAKVMSWLSETK